MGWLTKSWKIGRFSGVEIHLHSSMLLVAPLLLLIARPTNWLGWLYVLAMVVGFFASVLLHEMGHTIAAQLFGVRVSKIVLWPLGGLAVLTREPEKPLHEFIIDAAGLLVNCFIIVVLVGIVIAAVFSSALLEVVFSVSVLELDHSSWTYNISYFLLSMAALNILLVISNLLPIYPLDGGGMLNALMRMLFGKPVGNTITVGVGAPLLLGLIVLGIVMRDVVLLIFCVLLALGLGTLNPRTRQWINLGLNYLFNRAGYYILIGDYEGAGHLYTRALEKNPKETSLLLGRALCYFGSMAFDLSKADVDAILQLQPDHSVALQLQGEIRAYGKEKDLALADFVRVKEIKPDYAPPYFSCGDYYLNHKQYDRALAEYSHGIKLAPQIPLFFVARSKAYYRLEDIQAAHRDQAEALRLSPQDALILSEVNQSLYKGYLDWAQNYYAWVLEKYPRQWRAYQGRGDAYLANDQPDAAVADYSRALELAAREAILYLRRGLAHQKAGHTGQATADFRQALTLARKPHLHKRAKTLLNQVTPVAPQVG